MRGNDYFQLAAFAAVAEEGNFGRAAKKLGLSRSALSHTIRELEERLDVRLLNRTTRSVALTEAGSSLLSRVAPSLREISDAVEGVNLYRRHPSGSVRINLPKIAADIVFGPVLGSFGRAYPDVHLELFIDDDLSDIVADGFDAGIRPGELVHRDMIAVRITEDLPTVVVCSPAYLEDRAAPLVPEDLSRHRCIGYRWPRSGAFYRWPLARAGESIDVAVNAMLTVNDSALMIAAALDGAGLTFTLEERVTEHLQSSRLVRVMQDWCRPLPGFFLYHTSRRQMSPALRAVTEFFRVKRA
jgi:DNA-binding transcriptional LysR family regulator